MPLFSRRRAASQPPVDRSTHTAAQAAAAGALFNTQQHNRTPSLSSAAAAAALRSLTTTPEPVGSIQTKRMQRRGSQASVTSGSANLGGATKPTRGGSTTRGALQRNHSSGSMTERTFRSPSPGSINGGGGVNGAVIPTPDAPPVPALPRTIPNGSVRRSASVEPPQRVLSPTPRGGRGASVDRAGLTTPRSSLRNKRLSGVGEWGEEEGDSSPNSVNFSRPRSTQPGSPGQQESDEMKRYTHGTGSWFAQPTSTAGAARPLNGVPKRVQSPTPSNQGGPNEVSYDTADSIMVYDPNTRTFVSTPRPKPKQPAQPTVGRNAAPGSKSSLPPGTWDPDTRSIVPWRPESARTTSSDGEAKRKQRPAVAPIETALQPPPRNPARLSPTSSSPASPPTSPRAMGYLQKQPSIVREDPEAEEQAALTNPPAKQRPFSSSIGPAKAYVTKTPQHQRASSLDVPRQGGAGAGRGRNGSMSPSRSAHFSATPVTSGTIHNPPPRSSSPVKSAMKHSPASSIRTASPMANFSPAGFKAPPSDVSDITSEASEDGMGLRKAKKKVRVSFDEETHAIDAAGAVASPKAITSHESIDSRGLSPSEDQDSELMKPRPALPSFGSVRRNRAMSPEMPEKVTEVPPEREGISSDHAIGGIISSAQKITGNMADPLPPDVTSKDPSGAISDESEDDSAFRPDSTSTPSRLLPAGTQPVQARRVSVDELEPKARDFAPQLAAPQQADEVVPSIKLQPPTPGDEAGKQLGVEAEQSVDRVMGEQKSAAPEPEIQPRRSLERFVVPGGWAEEHSDSKTVAAAGSGPATVTAAQPKVQISEPVASRPLDPSPILDPVDEESDDSAAFSDAEEDLSYLDDGGFASLDAIVASPVSPTRAEFEKKKNAELPEIPTTTRNAEPSQSAEEGGDGWSAATAYWSKLSRQQRDQIEREHFSDDDEPRAAPVGAKTKKKTALKATPAPAPVPSGHTREESGGQSQSFSKTMRGSASPTPSGGEGEVHMRRSMRGNTAGGGTMQTTMRGNNAGTGTMQTTMRSGPPQQRPQSAYVPAQKQDPPARPMSASGPQASSRLGANGLPLSAAQQQSKPNRVRVDSDGSVRGPASQESSFPRMQGRQAPKSSTSQATPGAYTAKLQQKVTNDSDSESSFKKKKRVSQTAGDSSGRYSMKRSMRAGSVGAASMDSRPTSPTPAPASKRGGGAFSIRSLSPNGGGVFGKGKGEKLRSSLRSGSVDASASSSGGRMSTLRGSGPAPTMRNSAPAPTMRSKPAPTMRSAPKTSVPAPAASKSRFRSRFVDSDDEDEPSGGGRGMFRSRFADSDDDDDRGPASPALRPVRGIPRRAGQDDGDSTDLEDEDDFDGKGKVGRGRGSKGGFVTSQADVEKAMEAARRKLGIAEPGKQEQQQQQVQRPAAATVNEGGALGAGSMRKTESAAANDKAEASRKVTRPPLEPATPEKKKRSFMGSILRRNRSSQASIPQVLPGSPVPPSPAVPAQYKASPLASTSPPQQQQQQSPNAVAETSAPGTPSSVRGGKLVRRSSGQPVMTRGESYMSNITTATAPVMPSTLHHKDSDNWPLAPPIPPIPTDLNNRDTTRPSTSDGVTGGKSPNPDAVRLARTMRPDAGQRRLSSATAATGVGSVGRSVGFAAGSKEDDGGAGGGEGSYLRDGLDGTYSKRTGKKKKFGMLRKAFGLYD
ncbi:hypothetical protein LTR78_003102 [Recurvomyces mirabilis]|uniref:Uncharacterized protein n=1 Tax=Recurvomyces mirabilis TaxID=574656 RepID=A0AAE0WS96_9PEZI|nr:hypothetical protein LTR78_003102 [Recurvomyces mirabilis]KAK5157076.1 hypothetical protein LTS14_004594 [Recurvomyces mirabilis]